MRHPIALRADLARLHIDRRRDGRWKHLRLVLRRPGWVRLDPEPNVSWRILR